MIVRRAALLASALVVLGFSAQVSAATAPAAPVQQPGSGLSISPTRQEVTLPAGQTAKIDVTLKNITTDDVVAKASINDFTSDGVTGSPRILSADQSSPNSIKKFVVGMTDVPLKLGQQKTFSLTLNIPNNTAAGAYYGLLHYQAIPQAAVNSNNNGKVALSAGVSQVILITVPGNIIERLQLVNIHVYQKQKDGVFFTQKPDNIGIEVKNLGNGFSQPFGRIQIMNTTNKQVYAYELNGKSPRANVLPNSTRIFTDPVKNVHNFGRYTVVASIAYGDGSQVIVGKKVFWYLPPSVIIGFFILLALIVAIAVFAYWRYKQGSGSSKPSRSLGQRLRLR